MPQRVLEVGTEAESENFFEECLGYKNELYGRALGLTRDAAKAEDLVQDTFLRVVRYQNSFTRGTNLRAWLYSILNSVFINSVRGKSRKKFDLEPQDVIESTHNAALWREPDERDEPQKNLDQRIASELASICKACVQVLEAERCASSEIHIEKIDASIIALFKANYPPVFLSAYLELKPEFRVAFVLVDMLEHSTQEAADILKVPTGTVLSRVFRARKTLKAHTELKEFAADNNISEGIRRRSKEKPTEIKL